MLELRIATVQMESGIRGQEVRIMRKTGENLLSIVDVTVSVIAASVMSTIDSGAVTMMVVIKGPSVRL